MKSFRRIVSGELGGIGRIQFLERRAGALEARGRGAHLHGLPGRGVPGFPREPGFDLRRRFVQDHDPFGFAWDGLDLSTRFQRGGADVEGHIGCRRIRPHHASFRIRSAGPIVDLCLGCDTNRTLNSASGTGLPLWSVTRACQGWLGGRTIRISRRVLFHLHHHRGGGAVNPGACRSIGRGAPMRALKPSLRRRW
jgi:hypothetical protein